MGVRLSAAGVTHTLGGEIIAQVAWDALTRVTAESVDHMTQRVPMLTLEAGSEVSVDVSEGEPGWDDLVDELGSRIPLTVPDLAAALAVIRSGETMTLFSAA